MKLSELTPCDGCGGPLFTPPGRWFRVVRTSGALVTPTGLEVVRAAARQGVPLDRLEVDRSCPDAVCVFADSDVRQGDQLLLCVVCYHDRPIADIVRRRQERIERQVATGRPS